MTPIAMSTGLTVLAWLGLAAGLMVAIVVVALFQRIIVVAREIKSYADEILTGGLGIARNVDGADELVRTRDLASAVPRLGAAYIGRRGRT